VSFPALLKPYEIELFSIFTVHLGQGWAISGPRTTFGPPQRFQWPAEAFRKIPQIWNFLPLISKC